ncbi:hypothetical protein [Larkinella sp. C7]|jgi:hypothetical protein|uniref:hypothetical protein n=1 Tax=Larkinella sp. C7 TaxID=2576607 RepID=UPI0011111C5F|nr:hypothetical protein [Larkinella sp. C7]
MDITIGKDELNLIISKLVSAFLDQNFPDQEIAITEDYFWHIEKNSLYNVYSDINSEDLNLGSLQDTVLELKKLTPDDYNPVSTVDIRRISFIIRYLSGI